MSSTLEPQGQESRWMPYSQTRSNWELGQCTPAMSPAMKSATGKGEPSKGSKQGGQADEFRQGGSHVILRAWKEDAWSREALRQGRGGLLLSEMRKNRPRGIFRSHCLLQQINNESVMQPTMQFECWALSVQTCPPTPSEPSWHPTGHLSSHFLTFQVGSGTT